MKKIIDLMSELGFRQEGSIAVKEAFIKNLIKASTGVDIATPTEKRKKKEEQQQLSLFPDLDDVKEVG